MSVPADLLATLPDTVAAAIAAQLTGLRTCEAIAGDFDAAELKRTGTAAPAVLVALLGARQEVDVGGYPLREYRLSMAAFVVTRSRADLSARAAGQTIAQHLLAVLPDSTWDVAACGPAQGAAMRTMVTRETRTAGVHLIAVTWDQPAILRDAPVAPDIDPALYYSRAPEIGAAHQDDYIEAEAAP